MGRASSHYPIESDLVVDYNRKLEGSWYHTLTRLFRQVKHPDLVLLCLMWSSPGADFLRFRWVFGGLNMIGSGNPVK